MFSYVLCHNMYQRNYALVIGHQVVVAVWGWGGGEGSSREYLF